MRHNQTTYSRPDKQNFLGLWLGWLKDLGGSYDFLRVEREPNTHTPKYKPVQRPLSQEKYYTDGHGSVRRKEAA